ncbi:actin filament-associated protein 1-like 1 [Polypterus senegalus]|uniref:actin filament-associated protein 1-like 1 n=1 Tax=Polypterus senegalus TaxID=55291 RepID=UPI0019625DB2|nr:actin filament-associated protein 1-like 1 [Polypterus senegalus]
MAAQAHWILADEASRNLKPWNLGRLVGVVLDELIPELSTLLKLLDQENLSSSAKEKKITVSSILQRLKPTSANTLSYLYMNTAAYRNGTSFVESLFEEFGDCDLHDLKDTAEGNEEVEEVETVTDTSSPKSNTVDYAPPLPTTPPPEDYYEEAVPLSPGEAPEYITSRSKFQQDTLLRFSSLFLYFCICVSSLLSCYAKNYLE